MSLIKQNSIRALRYRIFDCFRYYASIIGFDSLGTVSAISLTLTGSGLGVAVYMSWTFISNMSIVIMYKKSDIGKEPKNTLKERNEGDFVAELWGLFVMMLGVLQFLDFVAGWSFFGKTISGIGQVCRTRREINLHRASSTVDELPLSITNRYCSCA